MDASETCRDHFEDVETQPVEVPRGMVAKPRAIVEHGPVGEGSEKVEERGARDGQRRQASKVLEKRCGKEGIVR